MSAAAACSAAKWQALKWPGAVRSDRSGTVAAQRSVARGQRVRKAQPEGGAKGLGWSPRTGTVSVRRAVGSSARGIEASRAEV